MIPRTTIRNLALYAIGIGLAIVGVLGLSEAIELLGWIAGGSFVIGLCLVVAVHEVLDGPF